MSNTAHLSWEEGTVISQSELSDHIFEAGSWSKGKLSVKAHCVNTGIDNLNYESFVQFVGEKFPLFVFPKEKVEEKEYPYRDAQRLADFKDDPRYDGKYGELILFILVDSVLGLPMVSHKIAWKQNPTDEVKGSDGLFFGRFQGEKALAIGEAKIHKDRNGGLRDSLDSTDRFHGASGGARKRHELNVAASNLSDNLSGEQIEQLAEIFTSSANNYRTIHPIFIGCEEEWLEEVQVESEDSDELERKIRERMEDMDLVDDIHDRISSSYSSLQKHWLQFFILPLEDADRFREMLKEEIYPYSSEHQ